MIYAGDQWIQLPTKDLYDTQMMAIAINAAKDMYEKGQQEMKDFKKEYGDFLTPITADQDWYNQNVTGKVRDVVNALYAQGIDPLRNAQGRAIIAQTINNMPIGDIAKLRTSAANAREFLKAKQKLQAEGKWNAMLDPYDGPNMGSYSTLESGIWDRISPTPYENMADFSKSYFDNISPIQRAATKNGVSYTISEITEDMLHDIADRHFNDLVSTPQGQMMYKYYKDQLGSDEAARQAFNNAVVSGNLDRRKYSDNYQEAWYQNEGLKLKRQSNALQRAEFEWKKEKEKAELELKRQKQIADAGGPGTKLDGISLANAWYDSAMANAWSADGITTNWNEMGNSYGQFGQNVERIFHDFGQKFITPKKEFTKEQLIDAMRKGGESEADIKAVEKDRADYKSLLPRGPISSVISAAVESVADMLPQNSNSENKHSDIYTRMYDKYSTKINPNDIRSIWKSYEDKFSIPMDPEAVARVVGTPLSSNKQVAKISAAIIDRLHGVDDVITNTSGYTKGHQSISTDQIRKDVQKYGPENVTVTPLGKGYGSLRKDTGSFEVMPKVRLTFTDPKTGKKKIRDCYVDIYLGSEATPGGSYLGNYKEVGGTQQYGSMTNPAQGIEIGYGYKGPVQFGESTRGFNAAPSNSARQYNMYPDYNRWTGYGVWDTDVTSSLLHASPTQKLGTY